MTDYGVHKAWIAPYVDAYVVASRTWWTTSCASASAAERPPLRHPRARRVFDKGDQPKLLREMGLDTDVPTVLFMAGSMGVSTSCSFTANCAPRRLTCRSSSSPATTKLYNLLQSRSPHRRKRRSSSSSQRRSSATCAADLIVTKPGGLTVSEALACNCRSPCSTRSRAGGQRELLQTHDMGVRITKDNSPRSSPSLIEHKERLRRMRGSCRNSNKSRANEEHRSRSPRAYLQRNSRPLTPGSASRRAKGRFSLAPPRSFSTKRAACFSTGSGMRQTCLPGGNVTVNETAEDALARTLGEALAVEVSAGRPLWICQSFFKAAQGTRRTHELCTCFAVDARADEPFRARRPLQARSPPHIPVGAARLARAGRARAGVPSAPPSKNLPPQTVGMGHGAS